MARLDFQKNKHVLRMDNLDLIKKIFIKRDWKVHYQEH